MNDDFRQDPPEPEEYRLARERLVAQLRHSGIKDERVLQAILKVPRHLFIEERMRYRAYEDMALPIEEEQTISQPYIVARMTETLLQGEHLNSVLEVGTGSGYQAAILAKLVDKVYSIERIEFLYKLLSACTPPLIRLSKGTGSMEGVIPCCILIYLYSGVRVEVAAVRAAAKETAKIAFAPKRPLFVVSSKFTSKSSMPF